MEFERFAGQLNDWNVEILATDVSSAALQQAQSGCYSDVEVGRGLSGARLAQHFHRDATGWRIDDRLKESVRFQKVNLTGTWLPLPIMDLVLLRNVLVYMGSTIRQSILARFEQTLNPDGYLMLGSSESVNVPGLHCVRAGMVQQDSTSGI